MGERTNWIYNLNFQQNFKNTIHFCCSVLDKFDCSLLLYVFYFIVDNVPNVQIEMYGRYVCLENKARFGAACYGADW